jgi:hypothetical protein
MDFPLRREKDKVFFYPNFQSLRFVRREIQRLCCIQDMNFIGPSPALPVADRIFEGAGGLLPQSPIFIRSPRAVISAEDICSSVYSSAAAVD